MKEQLYTIPVNDAFDTDCECPLCSLRKALEENAIDYTMGPSYMEDDNRALTDEKGFCLNHIKMLYQQKNRLGLALILKTHSDKVIKDLKDLSSSKPSSRGKVFKKVSSSGVGEYINHLESTCFICERIENTFERYITTIFHLWKKDTGFREKFKNSKGFCIKHYGLLFDRCSSELSGKDSDTFLNDLNNVFFNGMTRVNSDLEWFINKFDYRYENEPWKNSKDAIQRTITKCNHAIID